MYSQSLETSDIQAAKAAKRPENRISLDQIRAAISTTDYIHPPRHPHMTICLLTLNNGFVVIGKSAPADPENYDEALGDQFAYEDAVRQIWPLMAFSLRDKLTAQALRRQAD